MTDGIIKGTGNSRYLKSVADAMTLYPTYDTFIQALAAGTLPIDLNGINTAGWTQQGTPLNKANLLSDATETALWGSAADRTIDAALKKIVANTPDIARPIGDVVVTARTDLGEDYVLCNGEHISSTVYPHAHPPLMPTQKRIGTSRSYYNSSRTTINVNMGDVVIHDGYVYVTVADRSRTISSDTPTSAIYNRVFYAPLNAPGGDWTVTDIDHWTTTSTSYPERFYGPIIAGGYVVYYGTYTDGYPYIWYKAGSDPKGGSYTRKQISTSLRGYSLSLHYHEGAWYLFGYHPSSYYPIYWTATSLSGTWSQRNIATSGVFYPSRVRHDGDVWWTTARATTNTSNEPSYPYVALSPTGPWTLNTAWTIDSVTSVNGRAYHDGTYAIVAKASGENFAKLYVTDDPLGAWTEREIPRTDESATTSAASAVVWGGGMWRVVFYHASGQNEPTYVASTPDFAEWTVDVIPAKNFDIEHYMYVSPSSWDCSDGDADTYILAAKGNYSTSVNSSRIVIAIYSPDILQLPTLSVEDAYAYIKVKE